jgi:hypothetical protein
MAKTREKLISKALELLEGDRSGIRYSELARRIHGEYSDINIKSIYATIWDLDARKPDAVYKPARGLFRHTKFRETETVARQEVLVPAGTRVREKDFYQPFADWLVNELEECTRAIPLGGNQFKDKWGTPDVIGIRQPRESDILKPPSEIVSAEIKTSAADLITAFGQACSYQLFSHKSYLVIPADSLEQDIARLDALCRIFGIGLILFDTTNPDAPNFDIRVRATKHHADMFYANTYIKLVEDPLFRPRSFSPAPKVSGRPS